MSNVQDEYIAHVDEHEPDTDADDASGTSSVWLSMPDEAPRAELIQGIATAVAQAIDDERKRMAERRAGFLETQAAGHVVLQRYALPLLGAPIQIVREKLYRSCVRIVCYGNAGIGAVAIGLHSGMIYSGSDTVSVTGDALGGTIREIRTTQALWAIAGTADTSIDVIEEFGL